MNLNKNVCIRCRRDIFPWDNNAERLWNRHKNVSCPGKLQLQEINEIPYWCKYKLEHIVSNN